MQLLELALSVSPILLVVTCSPLATDPGSHNSINTSLNQTIADQRLTNSPQYFMNTLIHSKVKKSSRILNFFQTTGQVNPEFSGNVADLLNCSSMVVWRDLGPMHYPRFLKEVRCRGRNKTCMGGYFRCIPVLYDIKVLAEKVDEDQTDLVVPMALRVQWKFNNVKTSVGCICAI